MNDNIYNKIIILITNLPRGYYYCLHFTDMKTEAQKSQVICSRSHSLKWKNQASNPGISLQSLYALNQYTMLEYIRLL